MVIYKSRIRQPDVFGLYFARAAKLRGSGKRCRKLSVFAEHKIITGCMFACLVLSIFVRVFLGILYNQMIKEADNMAATEQIPF